MESSRTNILVLFEDGFWVAYIENSDANGDDYRVARYVFGPEPSNAELREFFLSSFEGALFWTESSMKYPIKALAANPKRRIREAAAAVCQAGGATKAREAIKLDRSLGKIRNAKERRLRKNLQSRNAFDRKQDKRSRSIEVTDSGESGSIIAGMSCGRPLIWEETRIVQKPVGKTAR